MNEFIVIQATPYGNSDDDTFPELVATFNKLAEFEWEPFKDPVLSLTPQGGISTGQQKTWTWMLKREKKERTGDLSHEIPLVTGHNAPRGGSYYKNHSDGKDYGYGE